MSSKPTARGRRILGRIAVFGEARGAKWPVGHELRSNEVRTPRDGPKSPVAHSFGVYLAFEDDGAGGEDGGDDGDAVVAEVAAHRVV